MAFPAILGKVQKKLIFLVHFLQEISIALIEGHRTRTRSTRPRRPIPDPFILNTRLDLAEDYLRKCLCSSGFGMVA